MTRRKRRKTKTMMTTTERGRVCRTISNATAVVVLVLVFVLDFFLLLLTCAGSCFWACFCFGLRGVLFFGVGWFRFSLR